jgi:hypothetical protein
MESKNYKIIRNFINKEESKIILDWIDSIQHIDFEANHHLSQLGKELNGTSQVFDISNTSLTNYIANYQSVSKVSFDKVPDIINCLIDRISCEFNLPKDNIFLQAVNMNKGGKINPHYDASVEGFINYKFNISVLSENYIFYIDKETIEIKQNDLYGFEASLYKHWTDEFNSRRVFLSFGFLIPYHITNRSETDPRVRLSNRIKKYFQK